MLSQRLQKQCTGKILFTVALILLRHCTGQKPMQCCPRGPRQHCIRKKPVQCCLNTLKTTLHRSKLYAMLSKKLQTTFHRKNPMQCCPRGSGKNPGNVVRATSGQSIYIYTLGPSRQKNMNLSFLYYRNRLTS